MPECCTRLAEEKRVTVDTPYFMFSGSTIGSTKVMILFCVSILCMVRSWLIP